MTDTNKRGFTLVELLVVIAIIGLLSTIAVVSLGSARSKARDTKRIADMKQVATALEQYYSDQGGYPSVAATAAPIVLGSAHAKTLSSRNAEAAGGATDTGSFSATASGTTYMGLVPSYPTPGQSGAAVTCLTFGAVYCYTSSSAWASATGYSSSYTMTWQLENTNPAAGLTGTNCTTTPNGVTCAN